MHYPCLPANTSPTPIDLAKLTMPTSAELVASLAHYFISDSIQDAYIQFI